MPGNLPAPLTRLVGRERALSDLRGRLWDTRLLTLCGPGGAGKTRLALALAEACRADFVGGAWWVDLSTTVDSELVGQTVAAAVLPGESAVDSAALAVARRFTDHALLVLDNCEQVIDGCAELVGDLLARSQTVRIIATSRQPIGVPGEQIWRVPGLSVGSDPQEEGATDLFLQRVREAMNAFDPEGHGTREAMHRIAVQLDGLPLAIELAAARVPLMGVGQVADRLERDNGFLRHVHRGVPERHQTLQQTVEWSHRLLSPAERILFRRLACFRGTFSLAAVEAVCTDDALTQVEVLLVLAALADQSLVQVVNDRDDPRYRLIETIRRYALSKLYDSGEAAHIQDRHAAYYAQLAADGQASSAAVDEIRWLERLELEHDNLRQAMEWLLDADPESAARLATQLWPFCYQRGYYREIRTWFEQALTFRDRISTDVNAETLLGLATVTFLQCDYALATDHLHDALVLINELGDQRQRAAALQRLGSIAREQGDYLQAREWHEQSLMLWESLDDRLGTAVSQNYLGFVAWLRGDPASAESLCSLALAEFRRENRLHDVAGTLVNLGAAAMYRDDLAVAAERFDEALALARRIGFQEAIAWTLHEQAILTRKQRPSLPTQARLLRDALVVHHQLGDRWRVASVLEEVAAVFLSSAEAQTAVSLLASVEKLRAAIHAPVPPAEQPDHEATLARAERKLARSAFQPAWQAGSRWGLSHTVDAALDGLEHLTGGTTEARETAPPILTSRELAVLELLSEGRTNREIASTLYISPSTAAVHVSNIVRKLGAKRRVDAAGLAHTMGLLPVA